MIAIDFLQDQNGDLLIQNGDFVFGESDNDHIEDIISSFVGEWKQFPLAGVGVKQYLNSSGSQQQLNQQVLQQLQADGNDVKNLSFSFSPNGDLIIKTDAIRVL